MLSYHNPEAVRIFELPIYRCTEAQHWSDEKERFESWIEPLEIGFYVGGRTPERVKIWEKHREDSYQRAVTLWDFNQVVGWIRLYAWPGQYQGVSILPEGNALRKSCVARRLRPDGAISSKCMCFPSNRTRKFYRN